MRKTSSTLVIASASSPQHRIFAPGWGSRMTARTTRLRMKFMSQQFGTVAPGRERAFYRVDDDDLGRDAACLSEKVVRPVAGTRQD